MCRLRCLADSGGPPPTVAAAVEPGRASRGVYLAARVPEVSRLLIMTSLDVARRSRTAAISYIRTCADD